MLPEVSNHRAKLKELHESIQAKKQRLTSSAASRKTSLNSLRERAAGVVQAVKKQQ
ncbi:MULTISPECIES: hypothetical protein [Sediminibacillus]|uniref:hypothetical protein n=1 Tax=Sediminibacillus TaxID=482460 RepID=UPI00040ED922|nr:hypothetical protein [Sediminibacillus terrae]